MARLLVRTPGLDNQVLELRLGVNHVGRDPDCDFSIEHSTVSAVHCELILSNDGVLLRDCGSTNGTFVDQEPVKEAQLEPGQTVRLGDVELLVDRTDVTIAIPKFERARPKPPVVVEGGGMLCPRHPHVHVTFKCTHCQEVMCSSCVHVLRRKGGQPLFLCPLCSQRCERLDAAKKKKRGFAEFFQRTARLPMALFTHSKAKD